MALEELKSQIEAAILDTAEAVENFRIQYLGRKNGLITDLFGKIGQIEPSERKAYGAAINALKQLVEERLAAAKDHVEAGKQQATVQGLDLTLPGRALPVGRLHPIRQTMEEIKRIFATFGFSVAEGPEIEDDWHNFTALNTPENHPARDMQDTFYVSINPEMVLRTQTSSVQVHIMENQKPPIRTISPGRVYRNEAISARAHCQFHQVEGLYIDEKVSFADLKQTLLYFATEMFGADTKIRLRPSYFPFTEPSAEVDISCTICKGKGCNICKQTGWVEILGCGMVDPQVLKNCDIDEHKYRGFAFGMGIERITMLKYQVKDLRLFFENDVRFLKQFNTA